MSDTPAPDAPVQTVQTVQDVPVNVEQTSSPTPIGSQTPERPVNQTPTRREAIQAAFDRANSPPPKDAQTPKRPNAQTPKAAEAKMGHNQPPEPTEKAQPAGIPRGERGQFAPRSAAQTAQTDQTQTKDTIGTGPRDGQSYPSLPPHAPYAEPPPRMAEHAKRDWAATPESVRGDVHRMHQEFAKPISQYQGRRMTPSSRSPTTTRWRRSTAPRSRRR